MIVVAGEALVDLAPRDAMLLPLPGGSPYNVAIGLGRLGRAASFLGRLSTDGFGARLSRRLDAEGVDLGLVARTAEPTTLAVVHLDDAGRASYRFYLDGTSASGLSEADCTGIPPDAALHVSLGAVTLDTVPAGSTLEALLGGHRGALSLDPNVRPSVLDDLPAYADRIEQAVARVDLVKVSDEDLAALRPEVDPLDLARRWARSGPAAVVVTRGRDGAAAVRPDGRELVVPGESVEVVDTVGAGDAFTSGLLAWLDDHDALTRRGLETLSDAELEAALRRAVRVSAVTCTRAGADPPRRDEL